MKIGTLVKVTGEKYLNGTIIGWVEVDNDIDAHIFEEKEVYGIYFGEPTYSNGDPWYHVLIGDKMYMFLMKFIEPANNPCLHSTQEDNS